MKKGFIFILLVFVFLALSGCGSKEEEFVLTKDLIIKNLEESVPTKIRDNEIIISELTSSNTINKNYLNDAGILIVEDSLERISCWSLFEKELIFEAKIGIVVEVLTVSFSGTFSHYIKTTDKINQVTVYDVFGNVVVETDEYFSIEIRGEREAQFNDKDEFESYRYIETILTVKQSDFDEGERFPEIKRNVLNVESRTRQDLRYPNNDKYESDFEDIIELDKFGLEGYIGKIINSYLYVYDSQNALINSINLNDVYSIGGMDGKLIYQKIYELDDKSEDYSFLSEGKKMLLNSYSQDIITGKIKELKLNYFIQSFNEFKDENDDYKYGYIQTKEIVNKNLIDADNYILIDSEGKKLAESGPINLLALHLLDNNHFYDHESNYILDGDFKPLFSIGTMYEFSPNYDLVFLKKDDLYGAVNYEGKVVIPFEYIAIETIFYNNTVIGAHVDGKKYLVSVSNNVSSKSILDTDRYLITPGLLFETNYNEETKLHESVILDYVPVKKERLTSSSAPSILFRSFKNIYGEFLVQEFSTNTIRNYVLIDRTYR